MPLFRNGKSAGKQSPSSSPTDDPDLLAERETDEFQASVRAAQNRAAARKEKEAAPPLQEEEQEEEILWAEQEDVYRPARVYAQEYLASLSLNSMPRLKPGESLILMKQAALEEMQAHLRSDVRIELGGLLGGQALYDPALELYLIVIELAMPARGGEGTAASFTYTPASWQAILPQWQQMRDEWTIVGSYHSHPGLGVFLSTTDKETQTDVFPHDWQVALVMDPIANTTGYFIGTAGKPCPARIL